MTVHVAVTGNIGSGKSTLTRFWKDAGVPVASADEFARAAVAPRSPALEEIRSALGDEVLTADGALDRRTVRERVFRDEGARRRLEEIIHPRVRALRDAWFDERVRAGVPLAVSEIPLLFETDSEAEYDVTVVVDAPEAARIARLVSGRGLSEDEVRRMMAAQMPAAEKRARADLVVDNSGSLDDLEREARNVLEQLRLRARTRVRLDLHLHTVGSWDCLSDPERVLERARDLGYARIAITDHDRFHVARAMAAAHPERIIPGEEVRTAEGIDVIGLYLSEEIPKGTPADKTIDWIRSQGGIPYLPHPYAGGKGGGGRIADMLASRCDVVEVFNARLHDRTANPRAEALADRHGVLRGAGSDAHTIGELGNAYIDLVEHPNRPEALLRALRGARTGGTEASRLVHLASTWAKVRKKLPGGSDR